MKKLLLPVLLCSVNAALFSQTRYLDEVFPSVSVTTDLTYGINASVLYTFLEQAVPLPLKLDVYEPDGDTASARPLVILFHSGNLLPPQFNGGCVGTKADAEVVEIANRLARMGYVVASADYRLGWDPTNLDQTFRVYTFVNAIYRGVQDTRTAVRFFKKSVAEDSNPFGIDPNRIAIWGMGTAGFVTYASNTIDTITNTYIPKLIIPQLQVPMLSEPLNGNVDGTTVGVVPPGIPWLPYPINDTLCYPNHVEYDSDFQLAVATGGALLDLAFIDEDDPPMIGMQVPSDPFTPCNTELIQIIPFPFPLVLLEVSGSCASIPVFNAVGANNIIDYPFDDPISIYAASINGNVAGFYPFITPDPSEGSPWSYTTTLEPYGVADSNCDTNSVAAKLYIDSMIQYFAPRACLALDLGCFSGDPYATHDVLDAAKVGLVVSPNPASEVVRFKTDSEYPIEHIYVYDQMGRLVKAHTRVDGNQFTMQRNSLPAGNYFAKVMFKNGFVTQQVMFR